MPKAPNRYWPRLAAIPALGKFCAQAEELIREDDPETVWSAEPLFRELLASSFVEEFLLHELGMVAENPFYFLMGSSEYGTPLFESPAYSLAIKYLSPKDLVSNPVISVTENTLIATWGGGSAEVETFALEQPFRNEVFDRSKRLIPLDTIQLRPGVVARLHSPWAFRLRLQHPTVFIQLLSATAVSLRWIFSPETMEPVRAAAARLSSSRLQFTCHTLASLGSPTSIPALRKLTAHPEHYVRWAAIQSVCAISREDGIECLRQALKDDHPHVRNAAQKTLANVES